MKLRLPLASPVPRQSLQSALKQGQPMIRRPRRGRREHLRASLSRPCTHGDARGRGNYLCKLLRQRASITS